MNVKLLIVLTIVLFSFCILPVNAVTVYHNVQANDVFDLGTINNNSINIGYTNIGQMNMGGYIMYKLPNDELFTVFPAQTVSISLPSNSNQIIILYAYRSDYNSGRIETTCTINYDYNPSLPDNDFDIDIDLQEQTIELGQINNLDQTLYIGSSSERVIQQYTSYNAENCNIDDLQRNFVKVKLNKEFTDNARIFLSGNALKGSTESEFNTLVKFNFTYIESIQAYIQTYDYQNGNMLTGVNMSVYEVIDNGNALELGNLIYSRSNSESQTILMLKQDTDYFIENELTGYYAVKNEEIASLNNRYGYLWNPTLTNPLRLYYSKLEPTAQYNANFIVQDVNNNGIAGVSVIMDNSVTKISNSIGGLSFNNVSAGSHTFTFIKNGYQTTQRTINIQLQYATFTQTLFADNQIIQPTVSPSVYPTIQPTVSPSAQPTISPIDKPSNIIESVSWGLAKVFGVKTVDNANYIFALLIILFPAAIAGGITHQALGFIAGGMLGFVFALTIGLVPIWTFFAMCLLAVIYIMLIRGNEGF